MRERRRVLASMGRRPPKDVKCCSKVLATDHRLPPAPRPPAARPVACHPPMPDKESTVRAKFELWVEQHPEEAEAGPRRSRAQETLSRP